MSVLKVHQKIEPYFESHRAMALEAITGEAQEYKSEVELIMAKAYLTFASSTELDGFEYGGTSFISEFRK